MDVSRLLAVDLNLLPVLHVLLEERSVTRAAERLGRTQSAVSHALRRIRDTLGDPILVRDGADMVPTARAESLRDALDEALACAEHVLAAPDFDPARCSRRFTVAMSDYVQLRLLPALVSGMASEAPLADLVVRPPRPAEDEATAMGAGRLDAAVMVIHRPSRLLSIPLFDDDFVVLDAGAGAGEPVSLTQFVEAPHVLVAPVGKRGAVLDAPLEEAGLSRRVALTVPSFHMAPRLLAGSDRLLAVPRSIGVRFAAEHGLRLRELGFESPIVRAHLTWHERARRDPAHRWLRNHVRQAASV